MDPQYRPYSERTPDEQYLELIRRIRKEGRYTKSPYQEFGTFSHFSLPPLVYRFENGFPILTERTLLGSWAKYVNELAAFINGATTNDEMRLYGTEKTWANWWPIWVYETKCKIFGLVAGDLGWASYGGIFGKFPTPSGSFNQFAHLMQQMQEKPGLRTHMVTSWYPPGTLQHSGLRRGVVVAPCHGTEVKYTIIDGRLTCNHVQRSCDLPVGGVGNILQYAALQLWVAYVLDLEPLDYIHYFMDAQIYENQIDQIENELLKREPRPFPSLRIKDGAPKNLFAFRAEWFELTDYNPNPSIKFPVTE